jgi:hypothetical protein
MTAGGRDAARATIPTAFDEGHAGARSGRKGDFRDSPVPRVSCADQHRVISGANLDVLIAPRAIESLRFGPDRNFGRACGG